MPYHKLRTPKAELKTRLEGLYWTQELALAEIAGILQVSYQSVQYHFKRLGINTRSPREAMLLSYTMGRTKRGQVDPERTNLMFNMKSNKTTLAQIGKQFGLSRQRIHQILKKRQPDAG